ncbi:MAG: hydrogenase nickel incorporation protein HypB [Bacilli bacterium]
MEKVRTIVVKKTLFDSNMNDVSNIVDKMKKEHTFFLNIMSAPGAGRTSLIKTTIRSLKDEMKIGVISASLFSDIDARAIVDAGADAVQLNTNNLSYIDANMVNQTLKTIDYYKYDLLILDNVGNLIDPSFHNVGANENVALISVPGGDDKPLKYPSLFTKCSTLVISKIDVISHFDFSLKKCIDNASKCNPDINIIPLSAKTGEGMNLWIDHLRKQILNK